MKPQPAVNPIDKFEQGLIRGGSRWIADLTEFFRDYRVDDITFSLYAKGKTRSSGFFLSKLAAWTILPNYKVGLFCVDKADEDLTTERLRKLITLVNRATEREEFHWSWLIVLSNRNISSGMLSFVTQYDKKELGLAVASTSSGQLLLSNNQVGKAIRKQLGLDKALKVN